MDAERLAQSGPADEERGVSEPSYHERALATGAPPAVIAALDILIDGGLSPERAVEVAFAAHRAGEDAEAFARHFVKLRRAIR